MPAVRQKHIRLLQPYLVGEEPRADGEWDMYCPLHNDTKRSAGINVETGVWYCHAGCGGGRVAQLVRQRSDWVTPSTNGAAPAASGEQVNEGKVAGWASALMSNRKALRALMKARGLSKQTIEDHELGWDSGQDAYTIPVRSETGEIWNVRRYQLEPKNDRRKIWSIKGMGEPRLYPMSVFDDDPKSIIVCEGELDALLSIQNGYPAVTRTGAAKVWKSEWGEYFKGRTVYLAGDMDTPGQAGNRKVARALERVAEEIYTLELPYEVEEKHGKDLTDFWQDHSKRAFKGLVRKAKGSVQDEEPEDLDPSDASVLESFDSRQVGKPLRLTVTIKGKRDPGYSIPKKLKYECTQDAGEKCQLCPLNAAGGTDEIEVEPGHPMTLEMIESSKLQLHDVLRQYYGAVKCNRLQIEATEHQAVEVLFARPSVDHTDGSDGGDYKNVKITSVGRHDTMPNNTVQAVGALYPDPRKQLNEFVAWDVSRMETSLDQYELDSDTVAKLRRFRPKAGQRPLKKLAEISRELSQHVTHIYGRPEMHAAMDLVFHSTLSFNFAGQRINRGWLQLLVVGDARTGKSEASAKLMRHYGAGEMVNCESASFAGIVGGLQQYGSGKEWSISWGAIPINDRRLVVLDEIGGLQPEEIGQMSDVRSRGVAQLTKIQQEQTFARTRLICLGNPRSARMQDFTYGVQAIRPLIGTNEDIARFDLAMSVASGEVDREQINRGYEAGRQRYSHEACAALVRWVWSRTPEQIVWGRGAEEAVHKAANAMGQRYVEDPPLVQSADIRIKIARVSVALAARLFSTRNGEDIVVTREHVRDAVAFMDQVYGLAGFGYAERSRERLEDAQEAETNRDDIKAYLVSHRGLAKFLRDARSFRRQDLEEVLDLDKQAANAVINTLWKHRMVSKDKGDIRAEPTLRALLREVKE